MRMSAVTVMFLAGTLTRIRGQYSLLQGSPLSNRDVHLTAKTILRSPYFLRCVAMSLNDLLQTFEDSVVASSSRFDKRCDSS